MSEKRRDDKGRILRTGESQRKDHTYQYRYPDKNGKRKYIYAPDLQELRKKEAEIQRDLDAGIHYAAGEITVLDLVKRYTNLKQGVRYNTRAGYDFVITLLNRYDFGRLLIRDVKISDVQAWFLQFTQDGRGYHTAARVRGVLKPAFQMAYQEDVIRKNPFDFKLAEVIPNDSKPRVALAEEQQRIWMGFIREDKTYSKYYDEFLLLLGTGMRVSELCGLTLNDLDFKNRRIRVERQLLIKNNGQYFVEKTKTEHGCRFIPMTEAVCHSLRNILRNRKKVDSEMTVDGISGFLLLNNHARPKVAANIERIMRAANEKYLKLHPEQPLPHITPHVLRHTFCTNMANAGMDIKALQYVMGHANVSITLNVYAHTNYDRAAKQMFEMAGFLLP